MPRDADVLPVPLETARDAFLLARDLAPSTRKRYHDVFTRLFDYAAGQGITTLAEVDVLLLRRFTRWLQEEPTPYSHQHLARSTVRTCTAILHSFLHFCVREGWLASDTLARWQVPADEHKTVEVFTPEQVERLRQAAKQTRLPAVAQRNTAILAALLDTGMRVSELCALQLDDVVTNTSEGRTYLRVHRKGHKHQTLVLGKAASRDVFAYKAFGRNHLLTVKPNTPRLSIPNPDMPWLFVGSYGNALTRRDVERIFERLQKKAGLEHFGTMRVSPHVCRHTFAVNFLDASHGDIYTLKELLGHTSVQTTEKYLRAWKMRDGWQQHSIYDTLTRQPNNKRQG